MVESLGIPTDTVPREWLDHRLNSKKFNVSAFEISFRGATTSGELRSLCGLEGSYTALNLSNTESCLPRLLAKNDWRITGFHGFSQRMFDRQSWWPLIGLEQSSFMESPDVLALGRCGNAFRGACDKDLLKLAVGHAAVPKSFVYVLTLGTHLPVLPVDIPPTLSSICDQRRLPANACRHIAALGDVLSNVITSTEALPTTPLVVVVGDHAPPFSDLEERSSFKQDRVPGFILEPVL